MKPISALKRNSVESRWQQPPSDRHGSADTSRQFAIMSVRVRGLVPTFPDGSQAAVAAGLPSKKKMKAARVVGAAAKGKGELARNPFGVRGLRLLKPAVLVQHIKAAVPVHIEAEAKEVIAVPLWLKWLARSISKSFGKIRPLPPT